MLRLDSFLSILIVSLLLISCSSNSSTAINNSDSDNTFDISWSLVALKDTLIFELGTDSEGNNYAFSGLEVFVSTNRFSTFKEIIELKNRNGFIVDDRSEWMASIKDSSILFKKIDASSFEEIKVSNSLIQSAEFYYNHLLFTTNQNNLLRLNPESFVIDTLYQYNPEDQLKIISIVDSILFLRTGRELVKQNLNDPFPTFKNLNLSGNQISKVINVDISTLFAGSDRSKVLRSEDEGISWIELWPNQLPVNPVTDLYFSDSKALIISVLGSGIFYSEDLGTTWKSLSTTDLDWNVRNFQIAGNIILAATNSGIYRSSEILFLE